MKFTLNSKVARPTNNFSFIYSFPLALLKNDLQFFINSSAFFLNKSQSCKKISSHYLFAGSLIKHCATNSWKASSQDGSLSRVGGSSLIVFKIN